jgi:hypothetical protein
VDTATQLKKVVPVAVNCVRIQRSAIWSYRTMGSPELLVSQAPPKPAHSVLLLSGPTSSVPVLE